MGSIVSEAGFLRFPVSFEKCDVEFDASKSGLNCFSIKMTVVNIVFTEV